MLRAIKASKVYVERYFVMILSMVAVGVVETYYIVSRQPIDASMLGFGLFGLLVYYFTLQYRPMKVLDKMLASMASDMPEALFFFDKSGKCIWVNEPGRKLIGVAKDKYDDVKTNLEFLFDDVDFGSSGWSKKVILGTGDEAQYTYITMRSAADEEGKITETAIITGATNFITLVNELRQYGFIVEMDDFGSGYSSLNLLKDVNIDVIKIDMQFLKDSERNSKAGDIIESIIDMSKKIGIDTLTEGVETAKQFERLYTMGCKLYQGFYFSKPVDLESFEKQWFD